MEKLKEILKDVLNIFGVLLVLFVLWQSYEPTKVKYLSDMSADDTAINSSDLREIVGVSDYVFIGYVEETHDYNSEKYFRKFPEILDYNGMPYTECEVRVVENIKGCLSQDKTFSIYKFGGITWSRNCILIDDVDDILPEKGKYYIFTGVCYADGTMIVAGGKNRTAILENGINETNFENSKVYQKYIDAYKNQITRNANPPYYLCYADVNYGDGTTNAEKYQNYVDEHYNGEMSDKKYHKAMKDGNPKIK